VPVSVQIAVGVLACMQQNFMVQMTQGSTEYRGLDELRPRAVN
jgi:hypothetical protein